MSKQYTVTYFITMNEDGDSTMSTERSEAISEAESEIGGEAFRTVAVHVTMTAPEIAEISVTAPDDTGEESATVAP